MNMIKLTCRFRFDFNIHIGRIARALTERSFKIWVLNLERNREIPFFLVFFSKNQLSRRV